MTARAHVQEAVAARLADYVAAARGAFAANTLRAVRADLKVFAGWAEATGVPADLPLAPANVAAFIDAMGATRKPATVARYVASLNHLHRAAGLPTPGEAEPVRLALRRVRRAKGVAQTQAQALLWHDISRILERLGETPMDLRDGALICLAYDSLARRSEIAALDVAHLAAAPDGSGRLLIARSKTDQEGHGDWRYLSADTMTRIALWRDAAAVLEGPLFRPLGNAAKRDRLAGADIARIFSRRARGAGIAGVSGHSTRVGAAQDALAHNLDMASIAQAGGWKSPTMVARYGARLAPARSAAARLAALQGR